MSLDIKVSISAAIDLGVKGNTDDAVSLLRPACVTPDQVEIIRTILTSIASKDPQKCMGEKVRIFTLLTTRTHVARTLIEPVERREEDVKVMAAKLNFLGKKFVNNTAIGNIPTSDLIKSGILEKQLVDIRCYSNFNKLMSDFSFSQNGFQFFKVNDLFLASLHSFSCNPFDKAIGQSLSETTTHFVTSWGRKSGIQFDVVVPLGFNYRDLNPNESKASKAYHQVHIDFQEMDTRAIEMRFRPEMGTVLGELPIEQYTITQLVNVWMPLNTSTNTLSLLDTNSFDAPAELKPFTNGHNIQLSLCPNAKQEWIASVPAIGQGVVFNSCLTPHSAVDLPDERGVKYDKYRRSVEGRFAFVSYKPKMSTSQNSRASM